MKRSLGARTLLYPAPVLVIGTYDRKGKANVMTAAWGGISCSSPPCISVSLRKATYTYGNIIERKAFTVNIPSRDYAKEADYFGIATGKNTDKFLAAELTAVRSDTVDAPLIKEFPLVLECQLLHIIEIGLHTQFIGEIKDVKADESVLGENGEPDMEKLQPLLYAPGSREYYAVGERIGKAFSLGKDIES